MVNDIVLDHSGARNRKVCSELSAVLAAVARAIIRDVGIPVPFLDEMKASPVNLPALELEHVCGEAVRGVRLKGRQNCCQLHARACFEATLWWRGPWQATKKRRGKGAPERALSKPVGPRRRPGRGGGVDEREYGFQVAKLAQRQVRIVGCCGSCCMDAGRERGGCEGEGGALQHRGALIE